MHIPFQFKLSDAFFVSLVKSENVYLLVALETNVVNENGRQIFINIK